jgi:hypothetical protein
LSGIKSLTTFIEISNFKIERVVPLPFSINECWMCWLDGTLPMWSDALASMRNQDEKCRESK